MIRVAIWSCSKRTKQHDQPAWNKIKKYNPDFCIDLGDSWYFPQSEKSYKEKRKDKTILDMENAVRLQRSAPCYPLLAEKTFSIYDDHCFGSNNSGAWLPQWSKDISKYIKLKVFSKIPLEVNNRRGIYYSHVQDGIKFIFLDVRTFREKYGHIWLFGRGFFKKDKASLLGLNQWAWLENELTTREQRIVICSGSTISGKDGWNSYKRDKAMLTDIIKHSGKKFLILTGDIHKNKLTYHDDFGCHEVTSSGVGRDNLNNYATIDFSINEAQISFHGKHLNEQQTIIGF